ILKGSKRSTAFVAEAFQPAIYNEPDGGGPEHLPDCLARDARSAHTIARLLLEPADLPARTGRGRPGSKSRRREAAALREHVYDDITGRMIKALEAGTVPWQKPWGAAKARPRSMVTGQPYQGINTLLLGRTSEERGYVSPWWGTYKQIQELGGHVIKGQTREA